MVISLIKDKVDKIRGCLRCSKMKRNPLRHDGTTRPASDVLLRVSLSPDRDVLCEFPDISRSL